MAEYTLPLPLDIDWLSLKQRMSAACYCRYEKSSEHEWFSAWDYPEAEFELLHYPHQGVGCAVVRTEKLKSLAEIQKLLKSPTSGVIREALENFSDETSQLKALRLTYLIQDTRNLPSIEALIKHPTIAISNLAKSFIKEQLSFTESDDIFETTWHAHDRRQIIRHLIVKQDRGELNNDVRSVLVKALGDVDWEVRVSAMIACVRLDYKDLLPYVAKANTKISRDLLPNKMDSELVQGIQRLAVMTLSGKVPEGFDTNSVKHQRWQSLYGGLQNTPAIINDYISHFIHYFSRPSSWHACEKALPSQLVRDGQHFLNIHTRLEFVWVPNGRYWAGESEPSHCSLKSVSSDGFFISRFPLFEDESESSWLFLESKEIEQKLLEMSSKCDMPLRLPSHLEWQIATGATDARPFAWGWGIEHDFAVAQSVCGLQGLWLEQGERVTRNNGYGCVNTMGSRLGNCFNSNKKDKRAFRVIICG